MRRIEISHFILVQLHHPQLPLVGTRLRLTYLNRSPILSRFGLARGVRVVFRICEALDFSITCKPPLYIHPTKNVSRQEWAKPCKVCWNMRCRSRFNRVFKGAIARRVVACLYTGLTPICIFQASTTLDPFLASYHVTAHTSLGFLRLRAYSAEYWGLIGLNLGMSSECRMLA